jgi:hypothetical protein
MKTGVVARINRHRSACPLAMSNGAYADVQFVKTTVAPVQPEIRRHHADWLAVPHDGCQRGSITKERASVFAGDYPLDVSALLTQGRPRTKRGFHRSRARDRRGFPLPEPRDKGTADETPATDPSHGADDAVRLDILGREEAVLQGVPVSSRSAASESSKGLGLAAVLRAQ